MQKKYNDGTKPGRYHSAGFEEDVTSRMIYSEHTHKSSGCSVEIMLAIAIIGFLLYAWSMGWIHISLPF